MHRPGAEIGRQAWLRAMCPLGRVGSSPTLGTKGELLNALAFFVHQNFTKRSCEWTDMADIESQTNFMTTPATPWHADVRSRFDGIFEGALLEEIIEHGHHMRVPAGTLLMDVGQQMEAVPLLLDGAIKIMRLDADGDEMLLYFLESGDSCALSMGTYMGASKSSIRAVSERDTSLVMVPVSVGQRWMKIFTSWSAFVLESYQTRLEEMLDAIDALAFMDLQTRLRRYLSDKVKIQGNMTLQTTHQEIANDLHTSRVVVSRLLKNLEKEGVLSLHRNAVEMKDF